MTSRWFRHRTKNPLEAADSAWKHMDVLTIGLTLDTMQEVLFSAGQQTMHTHMHIYKILIYICVCDMCVLCIYPGGPSGGKVYP